MFPDRVGKVVLDGNVDAVRWSNVYSSEWYKRQHTLNNAFNILTLPAPNLIDDLIDIERVLQDFYSACSAVSIESLPTSPNTRCKQCSGRQAMMPAL